jgi:hypothetical protein
VEPVSMHDIRWNALWLLSYRKIRSVKNHSECQIRDWIRQKEETYWIRQKEKTYWYTLLVHDRGV